MYLAERLRTFRPPLWNFVVGLADEDTFIRDLMFGHCCADSGGADKARLILLGMEPKERVESLERLVIVMRCARDCYARKGIPLNVDLYRLSLSWRHIDSVFHRETILNLLTLLIYTLFCCSMDSL